MPTESIFNGVAVLAGTTGFVLYKLWERRSNGNGGGCGRGFTLQDQERLISLGSAVQNLVVVNTETNTVLRDLAHEMRDMHRDLVRSLANTGG